MTNFLSSKQFYNMVREFCKQKNYPLFSYNDYKETFKMNWCKIDENVLEKNSELDVNRYDKYLYIIRCVVEMLYDTMFDVMKIERDENTKETPKRLAKMMVPSYSSINELFSGRWSLKPTLTKFVFDECTCEDGESQHTNGNNIIKIKLNLYSICSHHFLPFGTLNNPKAAATVCYIPNEVYPGLSKIGRYVNYISRRGWLQEKLTETIAECLLEEFKLKGVYVLLSDVVHTCSVHRGYADDTLMSTEYYNGIFKENNDLLTSARQLSITKS